MSSLALQTAVRGRLINDDLAGSLVKPEAIFDQHGLPPVFPSIVIGEGQTLHADDYEQFYDKAFLDLHIWTNEQSLTGAKAIADAVRRALRRGPWSIEDHRVIAVTVTGERFLRDPDGTHAHAIVSVEAILQELVS